jgi:hypothetical protein
MEEISINVYADLKIDFAKLYAKLSSTIQDWLPLPQLKDPDLIDTREHRSELLFDLYRILETSKGTSDPEYQDVFIELPNYCELINTALVQSPPIEGKTLDFDIFFHHQLVQNEVGGWLTRPMLVTPSRMSHKEMGQMLKVTTRMCHDISNKADEFEKVVVFLPDWNSKVCRLIMQAERP